LALTTQFSATDRSTRHNTAISALALKCHLGLCYPTEWCIKHRLLQVMLDRDADQGDRDPRLGVEDGLTFRFGQ
jgi:hypothetical protein